jgi:hypothetical protein
VLANFDVWSVGRERCGLEHSTELLGVLVGSSGRCSLVPQPRCYFTSVLIILVSVSAIFVARCYFTSVFIILISVSAIFVAVFIVITAMILTIGYFFTRTVTVSYKRCIHRCPPPYARRVTLKVAQTSSSFNF